MRAAVPIAVILLAAALPTFAEESEPPFPGTQKLVSILPDGGQPTVDGLVEGVSGDGNLVLFGTWSHASRSSARDLFVRNREQRATTRVSVAFDGSDANGNSYGTMASSGRRVAFVSSADNLVENDTNESADIFVRDLETATTRRIPLGVTPNSSSNDPAISADGRWVAYMSFATNLGPSDENRRWDVYVTEVETGSTERANLSASGGEPIYAHPDHVRNGNVAVSGDGRYVAFTSNADNLVPNDDSNTDDLFVRDRLRGETIRVRPAGIAWADQPSFAVSAPILVFRAITTELGFATYAYNVETGTAEKISDGGAHPTVSSDGRWVAFAGAFGSVEMFKMHDRIGDITYAGYAPPNDGHTFYEFQTPFIIPDGSGVVFSSDMPMTRNDENGRVWDVFAHDPATCPSGVEPDGPLSEPARGLGVEKACLLAELGL